MEANEVGNRVKALMKAKNITKEELAKRMGINTKTLSKKLEGKQEFFANEIILITKIFDLSLKECVETFFKANIG